MRAITSTLVLASVVFAGGTPALAADEAARIRPRLSMPAPVIPAPQQAVPPPPPGTRQRTPARRPAAAPQWRGFLAAGAMFQPPKASFTDARSVSVFRESATWRNAVDVDGGVGLDAGVFARLWRSLGAGVSLTSVSRSGKGAVSASYPHPFFFGRMRSAEAEASGLDRTETGVHVSLAYLVPTSGRVRVTIFGGPSFYSVEQTVVADLAVTEAYPYDTVSVAPAGTTDVSKSVTGAHVGADVSWYFSRRFGAGALLRYATASTQASVNGGSDFDLKAGGVQVGLGLRFRF
ncbi:MAG: outer membrane beta-barrel protein [Vicinamibacterales bacterium]